MQLDLGHAYAAWGWPCEPLKTLGPVRAATAAWRIMTARLVLLEVANSSKVGVGSITAHPHGSRADAGAANYCLVRRNR